jgi:hypothetical protein
MRLDKSTSSDWKTGLLGMANHNDGLGPFLQMPFIFSADSHFFRETGSPSADKPLESSLAPG